MKQVATAFRGVPAEYNAPASLEAAEEQSVGTVDRLAANLRDHLVTRQNPQWPIRKILVPTDYSRASAKAILRAVAMANQFEAALTILHVIDVNAQGQPGTAKEFMNRLWEDASTQIAQLACSLNGHVEAQTILAEGIPWEVICEKSCEFDLLVMAKDQRGRCWSLFSKHTARRVIENSLCPVMVVREQDRKGRQPAST